MNRQTRADLILMLLVFVLLGAWFTSSHATGVPEQPTTSAANASSAASATSGAAAKSSVDLSLYANPSATGGTLKQGDSYAFVSGSAAPLPPGLCPKNDSVHFSIIIFTYSTSSACTDMDCLEKVLTMMREARPVATTPVPVNYLQPPITVTVNLPEPKACQAVEPPKPSAKKLAGKKTAALKPSECKA